MGNSNSGGLSIHLNPSEGSVGAGSYIAGSKLSGTVYAQTTEGTGNNASVGLELHLIGKEDVKVRYTETVKNGDTTRTETRYSHSKSDIVRLSIPLKGEHSSLQAGQYAYNFELQIPEHLPSSMAFEAHGGYCNIAYKVKVQTTGKGRTAKKEVPLAIVAKPPSSVKVPNSVEPITSKIMTCCCFSRGEISFAALVDDTRVGEGETITVNFACKNESSALIEYATATIKQNVYWKSSGHSETAKNVLAGRSFKLDEGMGKRTKIEMRQIKDAITMGGLQQQKHQQRGVKNDLYRDLLATVNRGTIQATFDIPSHAKQTYHGKLITVSHSLKIRVKTPSCSTDPERKVALQIVTPNSILTQGDAPSSITPTAPPLPSGWDTSTVTTTSTTVSDSGNAVYGGGVTSGETEEEIAVTMYHTPHDGLGGPSLEPYSLQVLLDELENSLSVRSTIKDKLQDSNWKSLIRNLQPKDVVALVKAAKSEFDQTDVAETIAPAIGNFTCQYVVALLRSISEWLRIQFVRKLLPFCVDVKAHSNAILNELTDWEKISTEYDFEKVLQENGVSIY